MLKPDLINYLIDRFPQLPTSLVKRCTERLLLTLAHALEQGQRVEIRNFGSFSSHYNGIRSAFNPKTKQYFLVPEKYRLQFKMGKKLKQRINKQNTISSESVERIEY